MRPAARFIDRVLWTVLPDPAMCQNGITKIIKYICVTIHVDGQNGVCQVSQCVAHNNYTHIFNRNPQLFEGEIFDYGIVLTIT